MDNVVIVQEKDGTPTRGRKIGAPSLSTLRGCRQEAANVYRRCLRGELSVDEGAKFVYMIRTIAELVGASEIETRINQLEGGK